MNFLALKEKNELIAIAINLSDSDVQLLDSLKKQESLELHKGVFSVTFDEPKGVNLLGRMGLMSMIPSLYNTNYSEASLLVFTKAKALLRISEKINSIRKSYDKGILGQDVVYRVKLEQAKAFLELNDDSLLDKFPYVKIDSERFSITGKDAANLIVNAATASNTVLSDTESARLRYNSLVLKARSIEEVNTIVNNFLEEVLAI